MAIGLLWVVVGCGREDALGTSHLAAVKLDSSCPEPTHKDNAGHCVLDEDVDISAPLELGSSTKLNCKGHRIRPVAAGNDGPPGTGYAPSVPEVAIVLVGTRGAKVQNCVIGAPDERFDFGVVILAAKANEGGRNKILSNQMHVRAKGVLLMSADDNEISDNLIEWDGSAVGVHVSRDSDRNHIVGNVLISSDRPFRFVRDVPGTDVVPGAGGDVGVFHLDNLAVLTLLNVVIGNRLLQFPVQPTAEGEPPRIEDTVTEGNTITLPGPHAGKNHGGIVAATLSSRTLIRGNTVTGGIVVSGEGLRDSETLAPSSGAIVTRNVIDGARTGLNLRQVAAAVATFFGARISENDIINSLSRPVGSTGSYTIDSELSPGNS